MVDPHPTAEAEVATQVPAGAHSGEAEQAQTASAPVAGHQRCREEPEAGDVGGGMDQTDPPLRPIGVGPVTEAADGGGDRGQGTERDQRIDRVSGTRATEEVEDHSPAPAADGDVGEQRMQRVLQPGAAEQALGRPDRGVHDSGEAVRDAIECLEALQPADQLPQSHAQKDMAPAPPASTWTPAPARAAGTAMQKGARGWRHAPARAGGGTTMGRRPRGRGAARRREPAAAPPEERSGGGGRRN